MKKALTVIGLCFLSIYLPATAWGGTAFIPHISAGQYNPPADSWVTDIFVSNVSGVTQRVTISLYHRNGSPWANRRAKLLIGTASETEITTDANGEISVELQPLNTVRVTILEGYDDGHGKITGEELSGTGHGSLVAYANVRDLYTTNTSVIFWRSIPINGGNPF